MRHVLAFVAVIFLLAWPAAAQSQLGQGAPVTVVPPPSCVLAGCPRVNVTGTGGIQIGGLQAFNILNPSASVPVIVCGPGAGASLGSSATYAMFCGSGSGESQSGNSAIESVGLGQGTMNAATTGTGVAIGPGCAASEIQALGITCYGPDTMRDWTTPNGDAGSGAFGAGDLEDGAGQNDWAFGGNSQQGYASALVATGTIGTGDIGDVLTFTPTTSNACNGTTVTVNCTTGIPATAPTYHVTSQDQTGGFATLMGHINTALSSTGINYTLGDGKSQGSAILFQVGWKQNDTTHHPGYLTGHYPASWQLSWAVSNSNGSPGFTITYFPPFSGTGNLTGGSGVLQYEWPGAGKTITNNALWGNGQFQNFPLSINEVAAVGDNIGQNCESSSNDAMVGYGGLASCSGIGSSVQRIAALGEGFFPALTGGTGNLRAGNDTAACATGTTQPTSVNRYIGIGESDAGGCGGSATQNGEVAIGGFMAGVGYGVVVAGGSATSERICALDHWCVIGVLRGANLNSTADQAVTIGPMTAGDPQFLLGATKYTITGVTLENCSASTTTAAGGLYTAASKGGTALVASTQSYTNCTSATAQQTATMAVAASAVTLTGTTVYVSLTTPQGSADTGDFYVWGIPHS